MDKPIVFLSHSTKDKVPLAALKQLLDRRAAGGLDFFLSSDGQSIRLGNNWFVSTSDALQKAGLMFVFLSPQSADSKWIHFEAGYAYAQKVQVVPVCMPGLDVGHISAPLNLLQGFNLHSHESLPNLARLCNEKFKRTMDERFDEDDYRSIFSDGQRRSEGIFGVYAASIQTINVQGKGSAKKGDLCDPLAVLESICRDAEISETTCLRGSFPDPSLEGETPPAQPMKRLDMPGCTVEITSPASTPPRLSDSLKMAGEDSDMFALEVAWEARLSPVNFSTNSPVLDAWLARMPFKQDITLEVRFTDKVGYEKTWQDVTARLVGSNVAFESSQKLTFNGLSFEVARSGDVISTERYVKRVPGPVWLSGTYGGRLSDLRLEDLIRTLFERRVLWKE